LINIGLHQGCAIKSCGMHDERAPQIWKKKHTHTCIPQITKSRPDKGIIMSTMHTATVYQNTVSKEKHISTKKHYEHQRQLMVGIRKA
jgi:hypothetical protein